MKLSINAWAFSPTLSFCERVYQAKISGFNAIELNLEENCFNSILHWKTSNKDIVEMKKIIKNENVHISSICTELLWKYSISSSNLNEQTKAIDLIKKMVEFAVELEALSIVIIPGIVHAPIELRADQKVENSIGVWNRSCENFKKIADFTHGSGIVLGIENVYFNNFLLSPLEILAFIKAVDRPNVKAHLDLGNANIAGIPEDWIIALGDSICAIHVKDSIHGCSSLKTFCPLGLGSINWNNVKQALQKIKYNGFFISEQSFINVGANSSIFSLAENIKSLYF